MTAFDSFNLLLACFCFVCFSVLLWHSQPLSKPLTNPRLRSRPRRDAREDAIQRRPRRVLTPATHDRSDMKFYHRNTLENNSSGPIIELCLLRQPHSRTAYPAALFRCLSLTPSSIRGRSPAEGQMVSFLPLGLSLSRAAVSQCFLLQQLPYRHSLHRQRWPSDAFNKHVFNAVCFSNLCGLFIFCHL